jgi:hypothetical protein
VITIRRCAKPNHCVYTLYTSDLLDGSYDNEQSSGGKMTPKARAPGDERNASFGIPAKSVQHKPGFDAEVAKHHEEQQQHRKVYRRQPKDAKDIPQKPLAERIRESSKERR